MAQQQVLAPPSIPRQQQYVHLQQHTHQPQPQPSPAVYISPSFGDPPPPPGFHDNVSPVYPPAHQQAQAQVHQPVQPQHNVSPYPPLLQHGAQQAQYQLHQMPPKQVSPPTLMAQQAASPYPFHNQPLHQQQQIIPQATSPQPQPQSQLVSPPPYAVAVQGQAHAMQPPVVQQQQQQQAPPALQRKTSATNSGYTTAIYVPDTQGSWTIRAQGLLDLELSQASTLALVLRSKAGQVLEEFVVDASTSYQHETDKYIMLKKENDVFTFSFNDTESCEAVWRAVQVAYQLQRELPFADLQKFWVQLKFAEQARLDLFLDGLQRHCQYDLAVLRPTLSQMLDPYQTNYVSLEDFAFMFKWCQASSFHQEFLPIYQELLTSMQLREIVEQPWFHGFTNRQKAQDLMRGCQVGAFLIRFSSMPLCFALDLMMPAGIHHILLRSSGAQFSLPTAQSGTVNYSSLLALVSAESAQLRLPVPVTAQLHSPHRSGGRKHHSAHLSVPPPPQQPVAAAAPVFQPQVQQLLQYQHGQQVALYPQQQPIPQVPQYAGQQRGGPRNAYYDVAMPQQQQQQAHGYGYGGQQAAGVGGLGALVAGPAMQAPMLAHDPVRAQQDQQQQQSEFEIEWSELKLGKLLGTGGFGEVFEGDWRGTQVAVKVLSQARMSPRELTDFRAEVIMMSKLRHPNIVQFLGSSLTPPRLALITEYMGRGSLYAILHGEQSGPLPLETVIRMAKEMARGMNYLHLHKPPILHRDLKSLNILVGTDWTVKVADFGLSRAKDYTHVMSKVGTPRWTAPEVLASKPYGEKADVYSFGVVLWEMVTGEVPFKSLSSYEAAHAVMTHDQRPKIPASCSAQLSMLITMCWDREPTKRPTFEMILRTLDNAAILQ
eukprot:TRINITY_DN1459_c0_g2_i1.p1 TRINITY_DN1459_c0_g2~~TRINITY_DN1459_c0_g2_i1.p1  ORF type:complete len:1033 (-),score=276.64 TRINITY_DN1459_c0_g2_i1:175-2817(-)